MYQNVKKSLTATALISSASAFLIGLASTGIMGIGGYFMMEQTMTTGEFISFTLYLGLMIAPIVQMSNIGRQLTEAMAGLDRTQELLNMSEEDDPEVRVNSLASVVGDIEFKDVSFGYEKSKEVLHSLSFKAPAGSVTALVGSSGSGKSTIAGLVATFLNPDSGDVHINDIDTTKNAQKTRKHIGYIPENVNLYPYLSGLENLDYFCKLAGLKYSKSELENYLNICGLQSEAQHKKVSSYSKGMRQKIGIAIAYAKKATVYLLDEPASGLDPLASNELSILLKKLASEGATILMASHDIFRVREVCDRIGILKNGILVKELKSKDVSANELETLYLKFMQN